MCGQATTTRSTPCVRQGTAIAPPPPGSSRMRFTRPGSILGAEEPPDRCRRVLAGRDGVVVRVDVDCARSGDQLRKAVAIALREDESGARENLPCCAQEQDRPGQRVPQAVDARAI